MEQNAVFRVRAFARKLKIAVFIALKINAVCDELIDDMLRGTEHDIHGLLVVFIVSGTHGVLKIAVIVLVVQQHTHAALREKRIGFVSLALCNC